MNPIPMDALCMRRSCGRDGDKPCDEAHRESCEDCPEDPKRGEEIKIDLPELPF
jgi:hypothetical protein